MTDHSEIIKLSERSALYEDIVKDLRREVDGISKEMTALGVKQDELERRHVSHSERHENNYQKLEGKFSSLEGKLSEFKGEVLKRLDNNSGRDAVIKFLLGAVSMAVIGGIVTYLISGGV